MRINKCRIAIHTSRLHAASLQQEVSRQLHGVLKHQLSQRLDAWLGTLPRQQPVTLPCLRLDLGSLPRSVFSSQFVPKVMAALDEALHKLHLLPEQRAAAADDDRQPLLRNAEPVPEPPAQMPADPAAQFLRYLQTGYWPSPQTVQNDAPSAPPDHSRSPGEWLTQYLCQREQQETATWSGLNRVLAAPQARRRLLSCLTQQTWPLWQQRMLNLPALPASRQEKPDAITLLLLIWRQRVADGESALPAGSGFYQAELRLPSELQLRELAAFIARIGGKKAFAQPQIWLRRLVARHGDVLWQRFTPAARQQVIAAFPDMASLPGSVPPASATPARLPEADENPVSEAESMVRGNRPAGLLSAAQLPEVDRQPPLPAAGEMLSVHHAGLVLLWPLLPRWFSSLGLLVKADEQAPLTFASPQAQIDAIALLDALVWQDDNGGEWRSLFSKLLCGWPLNAPVEHWPDEERISELRLALETQLTSMLQQLQQIQLVQRQTRPGLDKLGLSEFCQLFLQRSGTLEETGTGWQLTVTPHPADLLLWSIPWPLEQLIYPWLAGPITIDWQMPVFPYTV